ncbi:MAG: hypothetical protein ACYC6N_30685 [Pirellulaceae bacterium]
MHRVVTALLVGVLHATCAHPALGQYPDSSFDQSENDDGSLTWLVLVAGGAVAATPFWGPLLLTDDRYSESARFLEYPYKHDALGNLIFSEVPSEDTRNWTFRAEANYAENFSRFSRLDAGMQLEGANRFGIDTGLNFWHQADQETWDGDFWTGDVNLLFRFAQSEWLQTRVGVGGNWLSDRRASEFGVNFTYKADVFIRDPLILSGDLDWGTLGDETLFHPRITLGAQWHRAELFIGCDYFDIGPTQATSLIAGGRFWY